MSPALSKEQILAGLPPEWPEDPLPLVREIARSHRECVVALDDDPTGTQSVYSVPVLTAWTRESLRAELARESAFYVLTNSRSLPEEEACLLTGDLGRMIVESARAAKVNAVVISRSDSTLRGHFPAEVRALETSVGHADGVLLIPAFLASGRFTANDTHFVESGSRVWPVGETEFARDPVFGYRSSNLRDWVEEKSRGSIVGTSISALSIQDIRGRGPVGVCESLSQLRNGQFCIVNAASERDLMVVAAGAALTESQGKRLLYRTAAPFVAYRAGIAPRALLNVDDLHLTPGRGGLIVVGSYTEKSSQQLEELLTLEGIESVRVSAEALAGTHSEAMIQLLATAISVRLSAGFDVVVHTSRDVLPGKGDEFLRQGRRISRGLADIVSRVGISPRFLLAKGGITSSDIAVHCLGLRKAIVLGQIRVGVPVWRAEESSRWPGLVYVVFPGNVGEPDTLRVLTTELRLKL
jgi:uncharacterized protein YgbK (DUF1537 family)